MRRNIIAALALLSWGAGLTASAVAQQPVKLGVLNDQTGLYADLTGMGSVHAARMAVEDYGGKVLGRPIEVIFADHQNKPDIGANLARHSRSADFLTAHRTTRALLHFRTLPPAGANGLIQALNDSDIDESFFAMSTCDLH